MRSIFKVLIFSSLFLAVSFAGYSQEQNPEQAQEYFEQAELILAEFQALDDARGILVTAADLDTTFIRANFEAGKMLVETVGKDLAVKYFLRVFRQDPDYRFDIEYWIGRSYQYGLDFDKAIHYYTQYKEKLAKKSALEAGHEYAVVWRMKFQAEAEKGTSWPTGGRAGAPATTETFAERQDRVGKKYAGAHRALRDAGRKAEAAVRRVAVFGDAVSAESVADLRAGLEALARHWGYAPAPE